MRQVSKVESQRGANGQATSGRSSRGGAPGSRRRCRAGQVGRGGEQHAGVRVARRVVERDGRAQLGDASGVHDGGRLAGLRDDRQVVRDQHDGEPELLGEPLQQLQDLRLHHHVERGRRLVGEQDARLHASAIAIAARWRMPPENSCGIALGALGADADELEQLAAARVRRPAARDAVQLHRLDDLVADALDRVEGVHRALEDHRDVAPAMRSEAVLAARQDVLAVQQHAARDARVGRQQPHQGEAERRLPAARLAHQAQALAARERELGSLHRVELAARPRLEPDVQVLHLEHGRALMCRRPRSGAEPEAPHRDVAHAQARVERVLDRRAEHRQADDDDRDRDPRRHDRPPGADADRVARESVLDQEAPRDRARIAQPEERDRGLGEDRVGDHDQAVATSSGATWGSTWRTIRRVFDAPITRVRRM